MMPFHRILDKKEVGPSIFRFDFRFFSFILREALIWRFVFNNMHFEEIHLARSENFDFFVSKTSRRVGIENLRETEVSKSTLYIPQPG